MENKNQQLQNQINNKNMQKKSRRRDGGNIFMLIFAAIFVALIARSFTGPVSAPQLLPDGTTAPAPVELTFSDILNRADEIKTMDVRGNDASGTLTDGTPYTATITYDPEMLGKIAENGATISIDTSKTWVDYLGTWVPILMGLFFIWWIFRGFPGRYAAFYVFFLLSIPHTFSICQSMGARPWASRKAFVLLKGLLPKNPREADRGLG